VKGIPTDDPHLSRSATALLAGGAVALLIASVAALFWPGVPMYDTVAQYRQVLGGPVDDWHPPLMARLWQLLHPLAAGPAPMFVIQVALYGVGFVLLVAALVRAARWGSAVAVVVLAVSPLLLGWQMAVLKDTQMLGALLSAVGIVAQYRLAERRIPIAAAAVVALLIGYATLVRANALFATVPLAVLLLPTNKRPLISMAIAVIGCVAVLVLTPLINHRLLGAEPSGVAKSEPLFDLAAIAVASRANAPSPFTPAERTQIAGRHCVRAFFWDPLGDPAGCSDATDRLLEQPTGKLYFELAQAAAAHPLAYAAHRLAHWNSTERWLVPPGLPEAGPPDEAEPNDIGLNGPQSDAATAWQDAAAVEAGTPLGWPILWTLIALLLLPAAWRRRSEPAGGLVLALLASALTLEASFLVISIASDLRYHLWPMAASALALILLSHSISLNRRSTMTCAALLALVIVGGLITRSTLPKAPGSYEEMIQARSG
jgi:hypothetical protein